MVTRHLIRSLVLLASIVACPLVSYADSFQIGIAVGFPPPPLPLYAQPPCPEPGYVWTPGYWAYDDDMDDYYWVPGTWVYAPEPGLLWTPGYWSEDDDDEYVWHQGYWAPDVGYYGGINYGYGYFGVGFVGGYWRGRDFYYNRAFGNVTNIRVTNIYVDDRDDRYRGDRSERASFNGREGIHARPMEPELRAEHEPHRGWTNPQQSHAWQARSTPGLLASSNHGRPPIAATERPGVFAGRGIAAAHPSTPTLPDTWRGFRHGSGRAPQLGTPPENARTPGEPASRNRYGSWAYPPTGNSNAPATIYRAPNAPVYPNAGARSPATPWNPPNQAGRHDNDRPSHQDRPNMSSGPSGGNPRNTESWHAPTASPGRAYSLPPAPPVRPAPPRYAIESHPPQPFAAPGPRRPEARPAPPPEHVRGDDARRAERQQ